MSIVRPDTNLDREEVIAYLSRLSTSESQQLLSEAINQPTLLISLPEFHRLEPILKLNALHVLCLVMEYGFKTLLSGQVLDTNVEAFCDKYGLDGADFLLTHAKLNRYNQAQLKKQGQLMSYKQLSLPIQIES